MKTLFYTVGGLIQDLMVEHSMDRLEATIFVERSQRRGSGFVSGNTWFPIQYTTRATRSFVAKKLNQARTIHLRINSGSSVKVTSWDHVYFTGLVVGMAEMFDAVANNTVEV